MNTLPQLTSAKLAEDQGPGIVAANLTVAILATVAVILRLLARYYQRTGYGIDDILIVIALVGPSNHSYDFWIHY